MQAMAQRSARLIAALEDLAAQEAAAVSTGDFGAAGALAERCAPLVAEIAAQANGKNVMTDEALRRRLRAIRDRRAETSEALATQMARLRDELQQTQAAQRRTAAIAPVYGARVAAKGSSQLSLVG